MIEFIIQLLQTYRLKLHITVTFKLSKKFLTLMDGKDSLRMFIKSCNWINFIQFYVFFSVHCDTFVTVSKYKMQKLP